MTEILAGRAIEDQARLLFELAAVAYRAEPNDAHFAALLTQTSRGAPFADLTDVTYEVARRENFKAPALGCLAKALVMEHRLQEAHHFCQLWVEAVPEDNEAHRLAVLIACQRIDVTAARRSFRVLQSRAANSGTRWALETIMLLAFWEGRHAERTARRALETGGDVLVPIVATDAAYRLDDVGLLIDSYFAAPELAEDRGREAWARNLLRTTLLRMLRHRSTQEMT